MTLVVHESGVTFGAFFDADVFLIEQAVANAKMQEDGVKSVEFILRQEINGKPVVSLVEAKSSIRATKRQMENRLPHPDSRLETIDRGHHTSAAAQGRLDYWKAGWA